jgi:hypothetical protein
MPEVVNIVADMKREITPRLSRLLQYKSATAARNR